MYWLLPLSWVPVIIFPSEDKFVNGIAMSVLSVIWWLLAIWTEETMRFVDRQNGI